MLILNKVDRLLSLKLAKFFRSLIYCKLGSFSENILEFSGLHYCLVFKVLISFHQLVSGLCFCPVLKRLAYSITQKY